MLQKITRSQQAVLGAYKSLTSKLGKTPTYREISEQLGINQSAVFTHIRNLEKKGVIEKFGKEITMVADSITVPVLGSIACGRPIAVYEECEEYLELPKSAYKNGQFYALRAVGDSMVNAGIKSGDTLIIRQQSDVDDGDIGVVVIGDADDERATLKRVYKTPKSLILKPENDDFPTQIVKSGEVRGKLVSVIRNY